MGLGRGLLVGIIIVMVFTSVTSVLGCADSISKNIAQKSGIPPDKPDTPEGPADGKVGTEYTYHITNPVNPTGDKTYYKWSWGDGSYSDWESYSPGEIVYSSHIWSEKGVYDVQIMAKNDYGESPWSDPLMVTISSGINIALTIPCLSQQFFD